MSRALVVIDVQRVYTDPESEMYCEDSDATLDRINRLVTSSRDRGEPIVLVRHVHKLDGSDLGRMFDYSGEPEEDFNFKEGTDEVEYDPRLIRPLGAHELIKNRYSVFANTDLDTYLHQNDVDSVTICGFMTNFSCDSTARDAHDRDYFVDFVIDATGTPGTDTLNEQEIRSIVGELLEAGFARVVKTDDFLEDQ
jgi:nicotinamidase-related amidase